MPKGLKQTSALIVIGATVEESAANTFTQASVDLQLNPLDNEVFVVQAINLEPGSPEGIAGTDTAVDMTMTTTSVIAMPNIAQSNTIGNSVKQIRAGGFVDAGVPFQSTSMDTPPADLTYLAIIATNDFFLQIRGSNNLSAKTGRVKVYGFRARADSSVYAALVQSELLSS